MRDPFPIPPPTWLVEAVRPVAERLSLATLPLHVHEVVFATALYTFVYKVASPFFSSRIIPARYKAFNRRTRVNWDVHVVSFFQSVVVCAFSLYIMHADIERKEWRRSGAWEERIWAYSGMNGLLQSFALGYFLWDLFMCSWHVKIFGWGMLAHAISAVTVFSFGYRPFVGFYAPVFLLYELSSPFLNIHWFCDKLDLTGSAYQAVNGLFLTTTFFFCRIVWGLYSSFNVFYDIYSAFQSGYGQPPVFDSTKTRISRTADLSLWWDESAQKSAFMGSEYIPLWLAFAYLASNVVLNMLNVYWFGKMVETIRRRFDPPFGTKGVGPEPRHWDAAERLTKKESMGQNGSQEHVSIQRGVYADGHTSIEISGTTSRSTTRSRRKA